MARAAPTQPAQAAPAKAGGPRVRWDLILAWCMRLLACAWVLNGLLSWAIILGVGPWGDLPFEGRATTYQAAIIYFAVIDVVAAVGLWLLSTWGGVMWLVAVISRVVMGLMFPRAVPIETTTIGVFAGLIVIFLIINGLAMRQREH